MFISSRFNKNKIKIFLAQGFTISRTLQTRPHINTVIYTRTLIQKERHHGFVYFCIATKKFYYFMYRNKKEENT